MFSLVLAIIVLCGIGFLIYYIIKWNRKNPYKTPSNVGKFMPRMKRGDSPLIPEKVSKLDPHICDEVLEDDEEEKGA